PAKPSFFFSLNDKKNMRKKGKNIFFKKKKIVKDIFNISFKFLSFYFPYFFHFSKMSVYIIFHIVLSVLFSYPKIHEYVFPLHLNHLLWSDRGWSGIPLPNHLFFSV